MKWIHIYDSYQVYKQKVFTFLIDEFVIQISNEYFWLWIRIEPVYSFVLGNHISEQRYMFVTEWFISLNEKYGKYSLNWWWKVVSRKMKCPRFETWSTFTIRKKFEWKSQSVFQCWMESFDDYHTCIQKEENACNLFHVNYWLQFFVFMYNDMISNKNNYFIIRLKRSKIYHKLT